MRPTAASAGGGGPLACRVGARCRRGAGRLAPIVATARSAFPDTHIRIEDQVAEGDLVATRYVFSGTQEGEMEGIPPTGNRVEFSGISIDRFSGGKLAETWDNYDALGMMQQLGVIPSPEEQQEQQAQA